MTIEFLKNIYVYLFWINFSFIFFNNIYPYSYLIIYLYMCLRLVEVKFVHSIDWIISHFMWIIDFFLTVQYFTRFSLIKFIYQPISPSTRDSSFVACLGSLRFLTSSVSQFKAPALLINFSAEKAGNNTWIYIFLVFNPTTSYHFLLAIFPYHLHEIKNKKKIEDFFIFEMPSRTMPILHVFFMTSDMQL